jgi:hypothetical protein
MSDRVQTAIKWLQWIAQAVGILLALLGGGQQVAVKMAPETYGSAETQEAAGDNLLGGVLLTIGAPIIAWGVRKVWGVAKGKAGSPQMALIASEASLVQLELHLEGREPDQAAIKGLRRSVAEVYSQASKPVLAVDVK